MGVGVRHPAAFPGLPGLLIPSGSDDSQVMAGACDPRVRPLRVGSDRCLLISLDSTAVNQFLKPTGATLIGLIEAGR